ncbi:unnamed protein product [Acanthoscelides obtectus]|nr:unnamed protein product [Acanthoscelides obtectus]CAK1623388.1 E3 ubiquitin-protein ligase UHRF1 [Acanthoscelides obtectus]
MVVLVNYNIGNPLALGNWYDFIIEEVSRTANIRGTVLLGGDRKPIAGCYVRIEHGIMRIEKTVKLRERSTENITHLPNLCSCIGKYPYNCEKCNDIRARKCRYCSCCVCGGKNNWESTILCDECDDGYHLTCLKPALKTIPDEDWYCPECKNDSDIVKSGERLKHIKNKSKATKQNVRNTRRTAKNIQRKYIIIPKSHDTNDIEISELRQSRRTTRSSTVLGVVEPKSSNHLIRSHEKKLESFVKHNVETEKSPTKGPNVGITSDGFPTPRKEGISVYSSLEQIQHLINNDKQNIKMWEECMKGLIKGEQYFLGVVQDVFTCVCCQEIVRHPVTTECKHNVCRDCFRKSFAFKIYCCPCCRYDLGKDYRLIVNKNLGEALERLFSV